MFNDHEEHVRYMGATALKQQHRVADLVLRAVAGTAGVSPELRRNVCYAERRVLDEYRVAADPQRRLLADATAVERERNS